MKRTLITGALVLTLVTLTGCGSKKTLTCTKTSSDNGFINEKTEVYEFKNDRITKSTQTNTVRAEGDFAQYIDEYKDSAQSTAESYNKTAGFKAKVESDNNRITITIDMDPSAMNENDFETQKMGENYDSMKSIKTDQEGYTCK